MLFVCFPFLNGVNVQLFLPTFFCLIFLYLCICIGEFYLTYIYLSNKLKVTFCWSCVRQCVIEILGSTRKILTFHLYCTLWINRAFYMCNIYDAWTILVIPRDWIMYFEGIINILPCQNPRWCAKFCFMNFLISITIL